MSPRSSHPLALGASVALAASALLLAAAAPASAADQATTVALTASAYGSTASVGPITSGKTAVFSTCSTTAGAPYGNDVAVTDLGALGKVGAVVTSGVRTGNSIVVTSTTGSTSLLGGLVQATAIRSTSTSALNGSTLTSSGSTLITGLKILGLPRTVPAGVGSRIDIPGVATVSFNNQKTGSTTASKQLTVDALRIDLLKGNKLGLAAGSVVVASSTSGASKPTSYPARGQAYGTSVSVGSLAVAGPSAYVGMPCGGTGGAVGKNTVVGLSVPGLVGASTVSSTVQSVEGPGTTTAVLGNTVAGVNLLNGAVTADAVSAKSSTTRSAAGLTSTNEGIAITNLKVLGTPVSVVTKDNTTIDVAGVGTLTLRKTTAKPGGQDVVGIELKVTTEQLGLKAGAVIQVASVQSRVDAIS